jgi:NADH-quinone oxidoreductase subunit G
MKIADIGKLDRVLVVGSFLRKDHPLIAQRLRQATKRGAQVSMIHSTRRRPVDQASGRKIIVAPSQLPDRCWPDHQGRVAEIKGATADAAWRCHRRCRSQEDRRQPRLGPERRDPARQLRPAACPGGDAACAGRPTGQAILGAKFGFLGEAANSVGGYVAKATPGAAMVSTPPRMLKDARQAYVVLGAEPELDCADGAQATGPLTKAAVTVVLTSFKSQAMLDYAAVLLPVSPFSETSGTFVNTEGRVQSFYAAAKPQGEARPAWKVLRVLGNLLGLAGFDQDSSEGVRAEVLGGQIEFVSGLDNGIDGVALNLNASAGRHRARCRRADPLCRCAGAPLAAPAAGC